MYKIVNFHFFTFTKFHLKPLAEMGVASAQYRLVTYYENKIQIMQDNPTRG